MRCMQKS